MGEREAVARVAFDAYQGHGFDAEFEYQKSSWLEVADAILAAGYRRSPAPEQPGVERQIQYSDGEWSREVEVTPAPQQVSTGECNCGYGGFHEPLNVNCRLYRPEGGESNE